MREEIEGTGADFSHALFEREVIAIPGRLCAQAKLPKDSEALHLKCMHFGTNKLYQLEERWIKLSATLRARSGIRGFRAKRMAGAGGSLF